MLKLLIRFVDSELVVVVRVAAMLFLILVSTSLVRAQSSRDYENERNVAERISVVETKAAGFQREIESINTKLGYLMWLMSAAVGERAVLLFMGKFKNGGLALKDKY